MILAEPEGWGWARDVWDAAIEAEVLRSTAEQGLPVEVDDEAALGRVARVLAQDALDMREQLALPGGSRGAS